MRLTETGPNGTIRVLQRLTLVGLLLPFLLFAVAAWNDRETLLQSAEKDSVKIVALFREQVGNLFSGHQLLLDLTVARIRDMEWETIRFLHGSPERDRGGRPPARWRIGNPAGGCRRPGRCNDDTGARR